MDNEIVKQEAKTGKNMFALTSNLCAEVTPFKGITYIAIRYWYKTDSGWLRKKNGISMSADDFNILSSQIDEIRNFVNEELKSINKKEELNG